MLLELDVAYKFDKGALYPLYELVRKTDTQNLAIFCGTKGELEALLDSPLDINISVSGIVDKQKAEEALLLKDKVKQMSYSIPFANITQELIDFAHNNGVNIKTWTVDDEQIVNELYRAGVDYIITNLITPNIL